MKDWTTFNVKYLAIPFIMLVFGMVIGFGLSESKKKPSKDYPIEVQCYWNYGSYADYPTMECDSIRGDTLWKDGNRIVTKNIINISFK